MSTPKVTIAIVEDDDAMRKSIERVLHAKGYLTEAFASAEAFLDSGSANRVGDLILLLDIHLPGMSGIELQRSLRASGSTLPLIFMTAYDDPATRAKALAMGCVSYLSKPFEADALAKALESAVTG